MDDGVETILEDAMIPASPAVAGLTCAGSPEFSDEQAFAPIQQPSNFGLGSHRRRISCN